MKSQLLKLLKKKQKSYLFDFYMQKKMAAFDLIMQWHKCLVFYPTN